MSEQKQVQLSYFKVLCVEFSHKNRGGDWDIHHLEYSTKSFCLKGDSVDSSYKMPIESDIQFVVRNLITIALTRMYEHGFDLTDVRVLDVYEKGKK